jgi:hypothetical protein
MPEFGCGKPEDVATVTRRFREPWRAAASAESLMLLQHLTRFPEDPSVMTCTVLRSR